jgi:small subunit ribosomal protein S14
VAKKCLIVKSEREAKFSTRNVNRCGECGRPRGFLRYFKLCRICFRKYALCGFLPGVKKASW